MLRQDSSNIGPERGPSPQTGPTYIRPGNVDIQRELDKLEEMLLDSPRIPLSQKTLVNEEQLLEQLDLVRLNLPTAFQEAIQVVQQKEEILEEAEQYAQEIVEVAERRAAQILDETGIIRQAEAEAMQIRQQVQQECEAAQEQTIAEIDRMRRQAQQEFEEMRRATLAECNEVQQGADLYADRVLREIEQQLTEMMRIIRNGRQQLQVEPPPSPPKSRSEPSPPKNRETDTPSGRSPSQRPPERPKK